MTKEKMTLEKIIIETYIVCGKPKNKDVYKCDCIESPNENAGLQVCPIHPAVAKGITHKEAVEIMAKAMCIRDLGESDAWENTDDYRKSDFLILAEAALKALLRVEK